MNEERDKELNSEPKADSDPEEEDPSKEEPTKESDPKEEDPEEQETAREPTSGSPILPYPPMIRGRVTGLAKTLIVGGE